MQLGAFGIGYYIGAQLPQRVFRKFTMSNLFSIKRDAGQGHDTYKGETDLVGRFRLFENNEHVSNEDKILNYLSMYSKDPLTKPELVDQMMKNLLKDEDLMSKYRIKRSGKDLDNFFYTYGKIHGLENIAFVDPKELEAANGNPVAIQRLVNKVEYGVNTPKISSHDQLIDETQKAMLAYRE